MTPILYGRFPMADQTHAQIAATALLQRPLADYVMEKRTATPRWPWRLIAAQLYTDTGLEISHESLRTWYGTTEVAA